MIIKKADMDKIFTQAVTKYLSKGMTIKTETMRGSEGEVGKIDLTDGEHIYRVLFTNELNWIDDFGAYKTTIQVKKYENTERTLWNKDGEVIEIVLEAWELGNDGAYTTDYEEARESFEKRMARYGCRRADTGINFNAEKVAEIVRRKGKYGYKRIKGEDITRVCKHFSSSGRLYYRIGIAGKSVIDIGH